MNLRIATIFIFAIFLLASRSFGDEVRYYEQNGVTYRETKQIVQRPVCETKMQTQTRSVCREQVTTEYRDMLRTTLVPVQGYQYKTYLENKWNPFAEPYYATYLMPATHYELRTETVKVPVVCRHWTPQCETVQVPVTAQRMVSQEVVTRVAVSANNPPAESPVVMPYPSNTQPTVLGSLTSSNNTPTAVNAVGGVARLNQDPPRYGTRPTASLR